MNIYSHLNCCYRYIDFLFINSANKEDRFGGYDDDDDDGSRDDNPNDEEEQYESISDDDVNIN